VLQKAFEGEFTREWREKQTNLPTAEELLETIKQERENWINKEISNNNSEAKRLKSKLKKYTVNSFDKQLPLNWKWTSFLQATHMVVDCHNKTAPYTSSGIHLIRTSNVKSGKLNLEDKIKFVNEETYKYWSRRCPPEAGDILFTREAPMGEAAIIPENTKICMGQRMMLLRVFKHLLNEKYLLYAILDSTFQHRLGNSAIGTGVKHLRVGDVENLIFPICSVEEQNQIVQEVESRLSVCDKIEETIRNSLTKAEALRQSILKKAFEGNLLNAQELEAIHTHPDYESAEKLLKRIKQERAKK
jgi:type I restriction enzyme S subunit